MHLGNFYGWSVPWIGGGVLVALFVIRSAGATAWFLARHPFAACDLGLSEAAAPGGIVRSQVRIVARRPARINYLRITLTAEQRDATGGTRELLSVEREPLAGRELAAGEALEASAELEVPENARFSYRSFEGRFRWLVRARLEEDGFGVAEEQIEVLIAPED